VALDLRTLVVSTFATTFFNKDHTVMISSFRIAALILTIVVTAASALPALASPFTGPTNPYYLDNDVNDTMYVVQGTKVINSFPLVYNQGNSAPYNESAFAITPNGVVTNGLGSYYVFPATAGDYSLAGTPTGIGHTAQATPGFSKEVFNDGTSDGQYIYTVQSQAIDSNGALEPYVIRTNLNWQNPMALFSVPVQERGITYDPTNTSLWLSDYATGIFSDYSLSGTLLSSFNTGQIRLTALALDPTSNTLWVSDKQSSTLEQWSKTGVMLQSGIPSGLPSGNYLAGEIPGDFSTVPEPPSLALVGLSLLGLCVFATRRRHVTGPVA
jgi:hypothetical protein